MAKEQTIHTVKVKDRFEREFTLEITGAADVADASQKAIASIGAYANPQIISVMPDDPPPPSVTVSETVPPVVPDSEPAVTQ